MQLHCVSRWTVYISLDYVSDCQLQEGGVCCMESTTSDVGHVELPVFRTTGDSSNCWISGIGLALGTSPVYRPIIFQ